MPAKPAVVTVMSVADREAKITQKHPIGPTFAVPMLGGMRDLDRKRLPLNLPIYRMVNMRTLARQGEYALEHHLADTFFEKGQEDQSAQQAQHGLLLSLAKADRANIHAALQKSGKQQDPLVLTTKGLVVNGNRRLAAMRDLYESDPKRFADFAEIDCAILPPDTDDDEIEYIETRLQVAPELRLDYGWVEEAIGLKRQVDRPMAWTDIAQSWGQSRQALKTKLATLDAANSYLAYKGTPRRYSEVGDDGQAFTTFVTRQASHATAAPSRLEAERLVFFALLAEKASLARGRVYNYAGPIEDITKGVVGKVAESTVAAAGTAPLEVDGDDPLAALPAAADAVSDAVLAFLRKSDNSATVAAYADAVLDEIDNLKRAKKRSGQFLQTATTIHSQASSLSLAGAEPKTIAPSAAQLVSSLEQIAKSVKSMVTAHPEIKESIEAKRLQAAQAVIGEVLAQIQQA